MQHQEIDMQGKLWVDRVATKPAWTAGDEGRLIYALDSDTMWFGTAAAWTEIADSTTLADLTLYARIGSNNDFTANQRPATTNTYYLGTSSRRWLTVYATNFNGTATTSTYADLAEKYTTPKPYPTGTIVEVSKKTDYDAVYAERYSNRVIGVVSEYPGLTMNNQIKGQCIGLVGRVPIRIIGPVSKRDFIQAAGNGIGEVGTKEFKIAIALESNNRPGEKLVECLLKL